MDLREYLPLFIQNFLSERKFQVRVGTYLSDLYEQEMEVPMVSFCCELLTMTPTRCTEEARDKTGSIYPRCYAEVPFRTKAAAGEG